MSKRKLVDAIGMHPNNPYHNNPPDFVTLAEQYPSLRPYVVLNIKGDRTRGSLNFRDPMALRELTYCLLHRDFSIKLDIPINSLCPAIPNRVNYICWIEDLMRNETESVIHGIDIGTGASCIYPLLGCTRNKNWRIMATDINDRSLQFAAKNVIMNNLQDTIVLLKSHPKKIFPGMLFQESEKIYDFCMCNPPFYEDEQDIQESHDSKEGLPSAVCLGMPNEMITAGGETQFVQRMIDESCIWRTRIRWYTSMLGKKTSVDKVVAYLKENNIFNITFTTFRQGRTTRWAVGWSFGDERASMKSMQQASKKMAKLSSTATVLSFTALNITIEEAVARVRLLLEQLLIEYDLDDEPLHELTTKTEVEVKRILQGRARANTWSRAARRALARTAKDGDTEKAVVTRVSKDLPIIMGFDLCFVPLATEQEPKNTVGSSTTSASVTAPLPHITNSFTVQAIWTIGQDRGLFESFFLHVRSRFLSSR